MAVETAQQEGQQTEKPATPPEAVQTENQLEVDVGYSYQNRFRDWC